MALCLERFLALSCSAITILKFLIFELGSAFLFCMGPHNEVVGTTWGKVSSRQREVQCKGPVAGGLVLPSLSLELAVVGFCFCPLCSPLLLLLPTVALAPPGLEGVRFQSQEQSGAWGCAKSQECPGSTVPRGSTACTPSLYLSLQD